MISIIHWKMFWQNSILIMCCLRVESSNLRALFKHLSQRKKRREEYQTLKHLNCGLTILKNGVTEPPPNIPNFESKHNIRLNTLSLL